MNQTTLQKAITLKESIDRLYEAIQGAKEGSYISFQTSPNTSLQIGEITLGEDLMQVLRNSAVDVMGQRLEELQSEFNRL